MTDFLSHEETIASAPRKGSNAESIGHENRSMIFQAILENGVVTRKMLAELSGLRQATITIIMNEFLQKGIVAEQGLVSGECGRRLKGFSVVENKFVTIAIRMNIRYVAIGAYDIHSRCMYVRKIFCNAYDNIEYTLDIISREIERIKESFSHMTFLGTSVCFDGTFYLQNDAYYLQDSEGYNSINIIKMISDKVEMVTIARRASSFGAYCIWKRYGAARHECRVLINIMISYIIECGVLIDGQMICGSAGTAGVFGRSLAIGEQLSPDLSILDDYIAPRAILAKVRELLDDYPDSELHNSKKDMQISDVIQAYMRNDPLALLVYDEAGHQLSKQIANLVNVFNPNAIIIGDEMPYSEHMCNLIKEDLKKYVFPIALENLDLTIGKTELRTENDIAMIGGSMFVTDLVLGRGDVYK